MTSPPGADHDNDRVHDLRTDAATLAEIAARRPDLHEAITRHPHVYPALIDWIAGVQHLPQAQPSPPTGYTAPPAATPGSNPTPPYAPIGYRPVPPINTNAILALVLGLVSGPVGLIFGHIALSQIKKTGERGYGLAVAGLVLGYLTIAAIVAIFIGIFGVILFAGTATTVSSGLVVG